MKSKLKARLRKACDALAAGLELPYTAFLWLIDEAGKVAKDFLMIIGT